MILYPDIGVAFPSIVLPTSDIDVSRWAVVACDQHTNNPHYWNEVAHEVGTAPSTLNYIIPEVLERVGADEIGKRWDAMKQAVDTRMFVQYSNLSVITKRQFVDGTERYGCIIAIDLERYNFASDSQSMSRPADCVVPTEATFPEKVHIRVAVRKQAVLEFPHILVLYDNPHPLWRQQVQQVLDSATPLYHSQLMKGGGTITGHAVTAPQALHQLTNIITNNSSPYNPSLLKESAQNSASNTAKHAVYRHDIAASSAPKLSATQPTAPIFYVGDGNHALASAKAIWTEYKRTELSDKSEAHTRFHPLRYALVEAVNIHDSGLKFLPIHQVLTSSTPQWLQNITNGIYSLGEKYLVDDKEQFDLLIQQHPASSILQVYSASQQFIIVCSAQLPVVAIAETIEPQLGQGGTRLFVHEWDDAVRLCKQHNGIALRMPVLDRGRVLQYIANSGRLPKKSFSLGHSAEKRYYLEGRFLVDNDYPYTAL